MHRWRRVWQEDLEKGKVLYRNLFTGVIVKFAPAAYREWLINEQEASLSAQDRQLRNRYECAVAVGTVGRMMNWCSCSLLRLSRAQNMLKEWQVQHVPILSGGTTHTFREAAQGVRVLSSRECMRSGWS